MSDYRLLVEEDVLAFLDGLDDKSEHICKDNLKKLAEDPYPGSGRGDKE